METYLHIGGLVAMGFDSTGLYLLTISHGGRGVFSTETWVRLARDYELAYPVNGVGIGIGPIKDLVIPITMKNFENDELRTTSPDGRFVLKYETGGLDISFANR